MARHRIILDTPMESLPTEEQGRIWRLSHDNDVFIKDINGELWQVLDLTKDDKEESVLLKVKIK